MKNPYLSTVVIEMKKGTIHLNHLIRELNEFMKEAPFIDVLNGVSPEFVALNAIKALEKSLKAIDEVAEFAKGVNNNE